MDKVPCTASFLVATIQEPVQVVTSNLLLHLLVPDGEQIFVFMPSRNQFKTQEEYNEYYRQYRARNRARLRIYNRSYNRRWRIADGYKSDKARKKLYYQRFPEKRRAHRKVGKALVTGRLVRRPCVKCGSRRSSAHHPDYSKPLDVVWLCSLHHYEIHH